MKILPILTILLFCGREGFSQRISPSVLGSAGEVATSGSSVLEWTAGESFVQSYLAGSQGLTEGFHQPKLLITFLQDAVSPAFEVRVWPNPAEDKVNIRLFFEGSSTAEVSLFNLSGQLLQKRSLKPGELSQVDISQYAVGMYFLKVYHAESAHQSSVKIQKIQ